MKPTVTVDSEFFGMTFFFDDENSLMYAPSYVDGGYDEDCVGYVSEWDDYYQDEGTNETLVPRLLDVIQALVTRKYDFLLTSKGLNVNN